MMDYVCRKNDIAWLKMWMFDPDYFWHEMRAEI
jgi:hypothetical protein